MKYKFDYLNALYRRNNYGQPTVWYAKVVNSNLIYIYHGILGYNITETIIETKRIANEEISSKIAAKRKTGYKYLNELKDNTTLPVEGELIDYLNTYLPHHRTTIDNSLLPMLAKIYDNANNKLFKKVDCFIGQWKINGLRCFISAEVNSSNLFKPITLKFQSREGTYWNSLIDLEDYLLLALDYRLLNKMVEEHYILDGELYLPGHSVNEINHFVKDAKCPENKLLQFWCYDIAIEDNLQYERNNILKDYTSKFITYFNNKEDHLNNKNRFVVLSNYDINNDESAITKRDEFINLGFEGLILRNPYAEYQFGKRNLSMIKFKKSTDGKFTIIDIYPEGVKRKNIPLFLCKNDINDATFECHVGGSFDYQENILKHKEQYIGKKMYVEYGERSGVNQVPFHIKETYIL